MLPLRIARFCCSELKERDISELQFATHSFGVRRAESVKRSKFRDSIEMYNKKDYSDKHQFHFDNTDNVKTTDACYTKNYFIVNPIAYFTDDDVWNYILDNKLSYNPLYDCGFKRVGCIGCPLAGTHRIEEFKRYPKYEKLYIRLCDDILKIREAQGLDIKYNFHHGQEYFEHWLYETKIDENKSFLGD